jgi:glucokinase
MPAAVIGIDLRPTKLTVASLRGRELARPLIDVTECSDAGALIDQIATLVRDAGGEDADAVGVSLPRIVEFETGCVVATSRTPAPARNGAVDLPLVGIPLRRLLAEELGVPVFVDNEANTSALLEAHDEELELVVRHLVLIAVGAGVGGGLLLDGRIYRGATGAAGELGHTMLGLDLAAAVPSPMGFPQPGSLEFVTAGHAFDRLASVAGRVRPDSELARLRAQGKPVLSLDVVQAARDGDQAARRMVEIWGQRIGVGIANAIHSFDPEVVVIGGDAARAGLLVLEPARRVARDYVLPGLGRDIEIRLARHGPEGGVLGAALLARSELS